MFRVPRTKAESRLGMHLARSGMRHRCSSWMCSSCNFSITKNKRHGIYLVLCLLLFLIKIFTMSRTAYLILLCLPFVMIFFVKPNIWFFIYAWMYFTLIKLIRFHSVGLTIRQILLSFTPFGLKYWRRLFEKDDVNFDRPL